MNWDGRFTPTEDATVDRRLLPGLLLLTTIWIGANFTPSRSVSAQACGTPDSTGGVTPCPPAGGEDEQEDTGRKTSTPVPPTPTLPPPPTHTNTPTNTPTSTATSTGTSIPDTATPTVTPTAIFTTTPTPIPVAQSVLPGAGIGAFILLLLMGLLLPAIQKIRVARRGY